MADVIAMILAGGVGSRLLTLSDGRAKPAVPFGSNFRIVDFTISNVMHSGIRYLGVMTQYRPYSLMAHIGNGEAWGFSGRRNVAKVLPPYQGGRDSDWYAGTADAVYQNRQFIHRFDVDHVMILSGDHIYNMVYTDLIKQHIETHADLTIATQPVPWEETARFGVLKFDHRNRIEAFQEKPQKNPISNQANLGIYIFKKNLLDQWLRQDAANPESSHDFGKDIIPAMLGRCNCYAFEFANYWRDVGTLQSFWEANMECLNPTSGLDLHRWHTRTNYMNDQPQYSVPLRICEGGSVENSIVGRGSVVRGKVVNSILFRGVEVEAGAEIYDSVIMDGARIGAGARLNRVVTDKIVDIGPESEVGIPADGPCKSNRDYPKYMTTGLTLIGKNTCVPPDYVVGGNCLIYPDCGAKDFTGSGLASGGTVGPAHHESQ